MIEFSSQEPGVRFWAMFSAASLAILGIIAGAALLLTKHNVVGLDDYMPRMFNVFGSLGTASIAAAWCLYMAALAIIFGYRRTSFGDAAIVALFLATCLYYVLVIEASIYPFFHGMRSVM